MGVGVGSNGVGVALTAEGVGVLEKAAGGAELASEPADGVGVAPRGVRVGLSTEDKIISVPSGSGNGVAVVVGVGEGIIAEGASGRDPSGERGNDTGVDEDVERATEPTRGKVIVGVAPETPTSWDWAKTTVTRTRMSKVTAATAAMAAATTTSGPDPRLYIGSPDKGC